MKQTELMKLRNIGLAAAAIAQQAQTQQNELQAVILTDRQLAQLASGVISAQTQLRERYNRRVAEQIAGRGLSATQLEILTQRYIQGKKWREIEETLYLDIRHIYRLHKAALQVIDSA